MPGPDRLRFEELLADISAHFVNVDPAGVDYAIDDALRQLAEFLDLDRAALSQLADDGQAMIYTHYWSRTGEAAKLQKLESGRLMPYGLQTLLRGQPFYFSSLSELPADAPDLEFHRGRGTKSAIGLPILAAGRVIGVLGFGSTRREQTWDADVIRRLGVIADVFGNALARHRAEADFYRLTQDRLKFESVVADIAAQFVDLASDQVDGAIEEAQCRLVEALDLDRSALFEFTSEGLPRLTHTWQRPELAGLQIERGTIVDLFPWIAAQVRTGEVVRISSLDDLPADVPDRENLRYIGSQSNVSVPLTVAGRIVGVLTFGALRAERQWPDEVVTRLMLAARIFASTLARRESEAALRVTLEENAQLRDRLIQENLYLQREVRAQQGPPAITGDSAAIRRMLEEIDQVARTLATVLLLGETGTGKELAASAIHERSPRSSRAMVRVNCAAIPVALVESELFGREKGAYTGALSRQFGRFELADGSTIFLDEIGELPAEVQVKLLRVLQERQIERLGSTRPINVDVRVIAATNRSLDQMVAAGTFREDLYYRLNVFPIRVPPLRERPEDIPTLVWGFVDECSRTLGKRIETIAKEDMQALQRYAWPGNVRELRNTVERAVITATGPRLAIEPPSTGRPGRTTSTRLQDVERDHIRTVLEQTEWRIRGRDGAAELLGLKPSTLDDRIAKLGLRRPTS